MCDNLFNIPIQLGNIVLANIAFILTYFYFYNSNKYLYYIVYIMIKKIHIYRNHITIKPYIMIYNIGTLFS